MILYTPAGRASPRVASQLLLDTLRGFGRQALHARRLALVHPFTEELLSWEADLPADMVELLAVLAEEDRP